jgi:hypothetical protein
MQNHLEDHSDKIYSVITGINSVKNLVIPHEKDIPVYEGNVQLLNLGNVQPSYTLWGDLHRQGDLFISLRDGAMVPLWEEGDLLLLKEVKLEGLIVGDRYYFLLKDGKEVVGVFTDVVEFIVITPENVEYEQVQVRKEDVVKVYKVMDGLKKAEAWREREKNK